MVGHTFPIEEYEISIGDDKVWVNSLIFNSHSRIQFSLLIIDYKAYDQCI